MTTAQGIFFMSMAAKVIGENIPMKKTESTPIKKPPWRCGMRIIWDKLILCLPMRNIEMEEEDIHIYI